MFDKELYEHYEAIIKEYGPIIIEAERIKADPEFKKAIMYFNNLKRRGFIRVAPKLSNNFTLVD